MSKITENENRLRCYKCAKWSFFTLAGICYFFLAAASLMSNGHFALHSDQAVMLLYAQDMLRGNFFLSGWISSGILFTMTEMPFYILGVLASGVGSTAYHIAQLSMFLALTITAFLFVKSESKSLNVVDFLVYLSFVGIPHSFQTHGGAFLYLFISCILIHKLANNSESMSQARRCIYLITLGFLFAFGVMSNHLLILLGAMPFALVSGYYIMQNGVKASNKGKNLLISTIVIVVATLVGLLLEEVYIRIGGMEHFNAALDREGFRFIALGDGRIFSHLEQYIFGLLFRSNADFSGILLLSVDTALYAIRAVFVIYGFILTIKTVVDFFWRKSGDIVGAYIGLGFIVVSAIFILTDMGWTRAHDRYFAHAPFIFIIFIIRHLKASDYFSNYSKYIKKALLPVLCAVLLLSSFFPVSFNPVRGDHHGLGEFLEENGLERGFSTFWYAAVTTVNTNNRVHITAAFLNPGFVSVWHYYANTAWFDKYANFVVTTDESQRDAVIEHIGEPERYLTYEQFVVLVYDFDLSPYFNMGDSETEGMCIDLPYIQSFDLSAFYTHNGILTDEGMLLDGALGALLHGPYIFLYAGSYRVDFTISTLSNLQNYLALLDIVSFSYGYGQKQLHALQIYADDYNDYPQTFSIYFDLYEDAFNVEFRVITAGDAVLVVESIVLHRLFDSNNT